jgi:hypothetical protein
MYLRKVYCYAKIRFYRKKSKLAATYSPPPLHPLIIKPYKVFLFVATGLKQVHPLLHGDAFLQERVDLFAEQIDFVEDVLVGVVRVAQATSFVDVGDEHGSEIPLQVIPLGETAGITPDTHHLPAFQKVGHVAVHHVA